MSGRRVELGLGENLAQFSLLVAVNALVGAMVGLERSTLPLIGEDSFGVSSPSAWPSPSPIWAPGRSPSESAGAGC